MAMNAKQAAFVSAYLSSKGNATAAAEAAGYAHPKQQGSRLLTNVDVIAATAAGQAERDERTKITLDYVVQRLAVEAELQPENGGTHQGRIAALRELRQHFTIAPDADEDAPGLTISFKSAEPIGEVRVTRSNG